jgi:membrane protease YdiL (CAAX protease family)
MKSFVKFLVLVAAIILLSAVLAPFFYGFLPFKFERIFNRLIMIFTLAAVIFFVRIRREMLTEFGLAWRSGSLSMFLTSFFLGFGVLSALCGFYVLTGYAVWRPAALGMAGWGMRLAGALAAGLVIGLLEEFFFRGFCYRTVLSWMSGRQREKTPPAYAVWIGILAVSIFYSLVHFVSHEKPFIGPDPVFKDSLKLVIAPFASMTHWKTLWPQALGLLLFGIILNRIVIKTKSLYPAIGLHAGCVFYIKINGALVDFLNNRTLMAGSSLLYDGLTGWVVLVFIGFVLEKWMGRIDRGKMI